MATSYEVAHDDSMSVGRVFALAIATIRDNPVLTLVITLLFGTAPQLLLSYATSWLDAAESTSTSLAIVAGMLASVALGLAVQVMTQAILTRVTVAQSQGRKASFGESAAAALNIALPLFGLAIVAGFGVVLGLVFLIVPGVIAYVVWAVAAPALVEERQGIFAALRRSADLTDGSRWRVFGVSAVLAVTGILATGGVEALFSSSEGTDWITDPIYMLASGVATTLTGVLSGTVQAAMYVELRAVKDGPASSQLADVFA